MVKLTLDLIARGTSGYTKKKRDESVEQYVKRLTHLYLEDKSIDDVGEDLSLCKNLAVLYLYDNQIKGVPNLCQNYCLTQLYLQNNDIKKMENLSGLRKLTKLYLGGNMITVLEGLDKLDELEELYVEHQRLPPGEKLLFEPRTLLHLARQLQVLNVSGNNLDSILDLECLAHLTQLMAGDNQLTDFKEIARLLSAWPRMWRLELVGNPLCAKSKYRDRVIVMSSRLEVLDDKEITDTSRKFLESWQASREAQSRKKTEAADGGGGDHAALPGPAPHSATYASKISSYVMPGLHKRQFEEVLARSNNASHSVPPTAAGKIAVTVNVSPSSLMRLQRSIAQQQIERSAAGAARRSSLGAGSGQQP